MPSEAVLTASAVFSSVNCRVASMMVSASVVPSEPARNCFCTSWPLTIAPVTGSTHMVRTFV